MKLSMFIFMHELWTIQRQYDVHMIVKLHRYGGWQIWNTTHSKL